VVRAAPTARTGEQAVRVAYALARRRRDRVGADGATRPVHAAALARDRRLAVEDATRLLAAARAQETYDALDLVPLWRDGRRLRAETPLMADALAPDAGRAVQGAEQLLAVLRHESAAIVSAGADADGGAADTARAAAADSAPGAGPDAARVVEVPVAAPAVAAGSPGVGGLRADLGERLAALPGVRDAYPMAPVVVTLGGYRQSEVADSLVDVRTPASSGGRGFGSWRGRPPTSGWRRSGRWRARRCRRGVPRAASWRRSCRRPP
jgi:hypothetical protein